MVGLLSTFLLQTVVHQGQSFIFYVYANSISVGICSTIQTLSEALDFHCLVRLTCCLSCLQE